MPKTRALPLGDISELPNKFGNSSFAKQAALLFKV